MVGKISEIDLEIYIIKYLKKIFFYQTIEKFKTLTLENELKSTVYNVVIFRFKKEKFTYLNSTKQ